jgi:ribosomal protein S18 acetylase RimI-like enzyme
MVRIIPFNSNIHHDEFQQMNIEYLTWYAEQAKEKYPIDILSVVGSIQNVVENTLETFTSLRPPNGVLLILEENEEVAGMIALKMLRETVGEVKRLYLRNQFRGRGLAKQMVNRLLEEGRKLGVTHFFLDTSQFMPAAQHIYRSAGFKERGPYPESEPPEIMRPYMIFMEKKE